MSRPTSASNSNLEYVYYTYQGRKATVQDPKGYTRTRQSDVIGELGIVTDPDGLSKTTYSYDPFRHLTQITDPSGNQTTVSYDTLGYFLTGSTDPDRGSWTYQSDSLGELTNVRDAKTQAPNWTQQLTWDALGRILQRVEAEGTSTWTWGTVAGNHEIGQLTGLSGLNESETYTFDASGRPATRAMTWAGKTYTVAYSYNTLGSLNQLTYPLAQGQTSPFTVQYGYTYGYTASVQNYTGGVAGSTFWQLTPSTTNMDSWGHTTDETLGTTTAVRIQSAYDAVTSWMNTRTVGSGGSLNNVQNLAYQWDVNGSLTERKDIIQSLTEDFNYDNLNRLQTSTLNGTQNLSVAIDATGNITSRTEGGVTYPYTYDTTHTHAVHTVGNSPNQTTYTYDANGNMATRSGNSVTWASYNLPTSIAGPNNTSAAFYYGPDRQRKEQDANYVVDGENGLEQTIYVFGLYEFESTPAQSHNKYFIAVPGGTQIVYDIQSVNGAQTTYITADHLGSGNVFVTSSGSASIKESYSAFGYRRSSNWSGPLPSASSDYTTIASTTRRGYTGAFHEMLDNLDLVHMNGRVYDPVIGRFLSPDSVVARLGDSQRGNPYSYVENRPLTMTDPSGFDDCTAAQNCKPKNPPPPPPPPGGGGNLTAGMYASMLSSGSLMGYANLATWYFGLAGAPGAGPSRATSSPATGDQAPPTGDQAPPTGDQAPPTGDQASTTDSPPQTQPTNPASGPALQMVTVTATATGLATPPGTFFPMNTSGTLPCGGFQCSWQSGTYRYGEQRGIWFLIGLGKNGNGQWVQSKYKTSTQQYSPDPAQGGVWGTDYSNGQWFLDTPAVYYPVPDSSVTYTFVAQTSYVLPNGGGAAFTLQWGFNQFSGTTTFIPPVAATPWPMQQQQIQTAQTNQ